MRRFTTALEKGVNPHPDFPFSKRSRGIADLIYIAPYNLPESGRTELQKWNWPVEQPFEMPPEQRAGILTHPAWLAAWSVNDGNDPIHRGIWVREKLLAGKLQDVPPDVDAKVPIDPHQTLRERMGLLREERCWNCHHKINPLGETFEMFDDWGRYPHACVFRRGRPDRDAAGRAVRADAGAGEAEARPVDATGAIRGRATRRLTGRWRMRSRCCIAWGVPSGCASLSSATSSANSWAATRCSAIRKPSLTPSGRMWRVAGVSRHWWYR